VTGFKLVTNGVFRWNLTLQNLQLSQWNSSIVDFSTARFVKYVSFTMFGVSMQPQYVTQLYNPSNAIRLFSFVNSSAYIIGSTFQDITRITFLMFLIFECLRTVTYTLAALCFAI
jgi:hypothetical protein